MTRRATATPVSGADASSLETVRGGGARSAAGSEVRADTPSTVLRVHRLMKAKGGPTFSDSEVLGDIEPLCEVGFPTATPIPTPTATATLANTVTPSPSPTATATTMPSPTSTPTATASVTPTPAPRPLYLPVLLHESCRERKVHADVALVVDASTSMRNLTRDGRRKIDAVQDAARAFVDLMELGAADGRDQVAVAAFNDTAWIAAPLGADLIALHAAIDALPDGMASGTRLDLAVEVGRYALDVPGRIAGNTAVVVLLTDGLPNRVPLGPGGTQEETVLAVADDVKARGSGSTPSASGSRMRPTSPTASTPSCCAPSPPRRTCSSGPSTPPSWRGSTPTSPTPSGARRSRTGGVREKHRRPQHCEPPARKRAVPPPSVRSRRHGSQSRRPHRLNHQAHQDIGCPKEQRYREAIMSTIGWHRVRIATGLFCLALTALGVAQPPGGAAIAVSAPPSGVSDNAAARRVARADDVTAASATTLSDACGSPNPFLVTTRFVDDVHGGNLGAVPVVFAFRDTLDDLPADQVPLATYAQLGTA